LQSDHFLVKKEHFTGQAKFAAAPFLGKNVKMAAGE
jgi:hypothetical protein